MLIDIFLKPLVQWLLRLCFRLEIKGLEHLDAAGNRVVVIANHASYLDSLLLRIFIPDRPSFVISIHQAQKWFFRYLDVFATLYWLDPLKPMSMKRLIQDLRPDGRAEMNSKPRRVVIFPEGRLTTSSGLMKIYEGTGLVLEKTGATLVNVRIDGTQFHKLSRMAGILPVRWFPKVRLTFFPPVAFEKDKPVDASRIHQMMADAAFEASNYRQPFLSAMLESAALFGRKHVVASDINRVDMNYGQLLTRSFVLSGALKGALEGQRFVAVMLPNALAPMVTFLALHIRGKIPCMLNYSSGKLAIAHTCKISSVQVILTSRTFVEKAKLEEVIEHLQADYRIIFLEDLRETIGLADKLFGLWQSFFPRRYMRTALRATQADDSAVIIYTSGSEGTPKGVALSHANILANVAQVFAILDINPTDKLFNAMPVFHSFGLSIGMLLPVVRGIKTFMYPSPLHYRIIPDLVYDTDSTVMLGTDTFYRGYAHYAQPFDFWKIRLAVAGAEKLKEPTRRMLSDRFRMNILEGYGVTETAPVVSVNTPMYHKNGSVGKPLPKMECRLEPVPGLDTGGRLWVKGPNVMLGYLKADQPGVIQPQGEWYDTGDIVNIDEEGYITILGRAKRFAKIAGEMVSLTVVEDLAAALFGEASHAAIAVPDERKGEQVVLFTECAELTRELLVGQAKKTGVSDICIPRHVEHMAQLPRLGNGKIDYVTLTKEHGGAR